MTLPPHEEPVPKYRKESYAQLNIRDGFDMEPKWITVLILEVYTGWYYGKLLTEPMYRTTAGVFSESALRPLQRQHKEGKDE